MHSFGVQNYFEIPTQENFKPFMNFGFGITNADAKLRAYGESDSESDTAFGWNIGLGVAWKVGANTDIETMYRFVDFNEFDFDGDDAKIKANEFIMSIKTHF